MKIFVVAGGSGGHIFPAIALADELSFQSAIEIVFVASRRRLDKKILAGKNYKKIFLSVNPMPYGLNLKAPLFLVKLLFDFVVAAFILIKEKPRVVVGFGGYTAGTVLMLAKILGARTFVHEQNLVPGRANRILDKIVDCICVGFRESNKYFKNPNIIFTGNPLRQSMTQQDKEREYGYFNLQAGKFTLLVMGGSQGARSLNRLAQEAISRLSIDVRENIQVVHITGDKDFEAISFNYRTKGVRAKVFSFIDDIHRAYKITDLAISRSGASAIFELSLYQRPMVLVPYPFKKNNQRFNAEFFEKCGAAICREEDTLGGTGLCDLIGSLVRDPAKLKKLGEGARKLSCPDAALKLKRAVMGEVSD